MATGVLSWSQTAATNASADSAINWAEGMSPSAVNDSARATMASVAKWRDDLNGSITTTGTSTAYAVTTNQGMTPSNNDVVAFVPHTTNGATVTLNVDATGALPLRSAPSTELAAGVLVQGTPYVATYQSATSEWILQSFFGNPYSIPIGGIMPYVGGTAPNSSFVLPYGQAISRTTYSSLFSLCSTSFGTGDGSTTFNVPDLRGRVLVGQDNMGGTIAGRMTTASGVDGTTKGASGGSETHTLIVSEIPKGIYSISDPGHSHPNSKPAVTGLTSGGGSYNAATLGPTGNATTGISLVDNANDGAHNNVQPSLVVPWILRVI